MKSRRRINKILFDKKTDKKALEPAKREIDLVADTGSRRINLSFGKIGIMTACLILLIFLFLVIYYQVFIGPIDNVPPTELEHIYYKKVDLSFDVIELNDIPADYKIIENPAANEVKRFYKDDTVVYYELNYEYMDEQNYDYVTLIAQRSHIHLDTLDSYEFSDEMEYKGYKILYEHSQSEDFYTYKLKIQVNRTIYYLKTITVNSERLYFYLDRLLL